MTTIARIFTILMLAASLLGGAIASAAEVIPSPQEQALLALINQARQNPLAVAASMGMDTGKILKDLPGLERILQEGLPALTFNGTLAATARAHTRDMFANNSYSHVSHEGMGYDERIRASGYPAVATGESLGMLFFANFIKPADAARILFEYMFWDELDPLRKEKRTILNPDLAEAGVSVGTGVLRLGGVPWNVYLATVDFGDPLSGAEVELLRLINQARANPLAAAGSLGIYTAKYLEARPDLRAAFEQGLAPLTINADLVAAARGHVRDMLTNNYFGKISADGRTYADRIAASGYRFAAAGESLGLVWVFTQSVDPLAAAARIFQRMLQNEFDPSNAGALAILDPSMKDAGIALREGAFRRWDGEWKVSLGVCDVGMPSVVIGGAPQTW